MPVKLAKGGNLSLSKAEPGLELVLVGLGCICFSLFSIVSILESGTS